MGLIEAELLGHRLRFEAAPGLFSQDRIDDGTRLLLEQLPSSAPSRVLDLGCGYGALGLPVAARFPDARCLLVDRDLVAVRASAANSTANRLGNVDVRPSLGYREVPAELRFDWVLCNVPARIGEGALHYLLLEGARRLSAGGAVRVVVINDLRPLVERCSPTPREVARGERHSVYELGPLPPADGVDHEALYLRDTVEVEGLTLERPSDISEDPTHLRDAVPLLLQLLPRAPKGTALLWRAGYGAAAVTLALRGAQVIVADKDLLAATFARRNAARAGASVEVRPAASLEEALRPGELHPWVIGELHPSAGDAAVIADVAASTRALKPGGTALWLGLTRSVKPWAGKLEKAKASLTTVATRGAYSVWRATARR